MKKSIAIVLGLTSLVACTKSSVSYEQTDQISFAPIANVNKTKAAISGTAFPETNLMGVYAYYKDVAAGSANTTFVTPDTYLSKADFKKNGTTWAGWDTKNDTHNPYYWPKTGSLIFAAYSPETAELTHTFSVANGVITDKFSKDDYVQSSDLSKTVDLLWSPVTGVSYDKTSGKDGVPMTFYHAMSWVTINAVAANAQSENKFAIKSLKLKKVTGKGSFYTNKDAITWSPSVVAADKNTLAVYSVEEATKVTTTAQVLEKVSQGTVVIPQNLDEVELEITFIQATGNTGAWTADQTITVPLKDCKSGTETISAWGSGKHYIYTLAFNYDSDEITIAPDVKDWKDVTVDKISVN